MTRRRVRRIEILAANIASKPRVPELGEAIARHRPHAVVVTEAYRARDFLDDIPGYKLRQYRRRFGAEAPGVAILVRSRIPIKWRRIMRMDRRWFGPFSGRAREPRRYQKLAVIVGGTRWPILAVHFPPGGPSGGRRVGGRNADAWAESRNRAGRWGRRRRRGVIVGDLNATGAELAGLTAEVDGQLAMGGKVDGCIAIGAHVRSQRLDENEKPEHMHGWALYYLTAR